MSQPLVELLRLEDARTGFNYGVNRVRFPAPLPVESRIRSSFRITEVTKVAGGGVQVTTTATTEIEGSAKPVCVAELVARYYR